MGLCWVFGVVWCLYMVSHKNAVKSDFCVSVVLLGVVLAVLGAVVVVLSVVVSLCLWWSWVCRSFLVSLVVVCGRGVLLGVSLGVCVSVGRFWLSVGVVLWWCWCRLVFGCRLVVSMVQD